MGELSTHLYHYSVDFHTGLKKKKCAKCERPLSEGFIDLIKDPLTTRVRTAYFHISCFVPRIRHPFMIEMRQRQNVSAKAIKAAEKVIEDWNLQFLPPRVEVKQIVVTKTNTNQLRLWVEVFKFFTPEALSVFSQVSKSFHNLTWNAELWREITGISGLTAVEIKEKYVKLKLNTCFVCKSSEISELYLNFLVKRCFCVDCYKKSYHYNLKNKFALRNLDYLFKRYRIGRDFIDRNAIPVFEDEDFTHRTYPYLIEKAREKTSDETICSHSMLKRRKISDSK